MVEVYPGEGYMIMMSMFERFTRTNCIIPTYNVDYNQYPHNNSYPEMSSYFETIFYS